MVRVTSYFFTNEGPVLENLSSLMHIFISAIVHGTVHVFRQEEIRELNQHGFYLCILHILYIQLVLLYDAPPTPPPIYLPEPDLDLALCRRAAALSAFSLLISSETALGTVGSHYCQGPSCALWVYGHTEPGSGMSPHESPHSKRLAIVSTQWGGVEPEAPRRGGGT